MALTRYSNKTLRDDRRAAVARAVAICEEYEAAGMVLTLRQLYYQHVARDLIPNNQNSYNRLQDLCNDARMAGLMDWDHIIDRTRNLQSYNFWAGPEEAIKSIVDRYNRDLWKTQQRRIEVWIEKDAAIGVIEGVCARNKVPYFSTRGYPSVSEVHSAAQRIRWYVEKGERVTILHIGDHDPSGLDMTRDIEDRLRTFIHVDWAGLHPGTFDVPPGRRTRGDFRAAMRRHMREEKGSPIADGEPPWEFRRIALNIDQVERYNPPPNPAKQSDARYARYVAETGLDESWELDALDPLVLDQLIQSEVDWARDADKWDDAEFEMELERETLKLAAARWDEVVAMVRPNGTPGSDRKA